MSQQGLQVFNASGNIILNIGSRALKIATQANITSGTNATINFTNTTGGTPIVAVVPPAGNFNGNVQPALSVSPNRVDVTWPSGTVSGQNETLFVMVF